VTVAVSKPVTAHRSGGSIVVCEEAVGHRHRLPPGRHLPRRRRDVRRPHTHKTVKRIIENLEPDRLGLAATASSSSTPFRSGQVRRPFDSRLRSTAASGRLLQRRTVARAGGRKGGRRLLRAGGLALDLAARHVVVKEAGGRCTELSGGARPKGGSIICTYGALHDGVLAALACEQAWADRAPTGIRAARGATWRRRRRPPRALRRRRTPRRPQEPRAAMLPVRRDRPSRRST